jgi:hypothetical protein
VFLQPLTANITPHPVPVAPLADQRKHGDDCGYSVEN